MNRYSRLDNQSPSESRIKAESVPVGRSAHDCSHIYSGNAIFGMLTPVLCMEVVPNEDIDIASAALLEFRNPTTRQLFNSCRVFFHAYYNRLIDLWEGAKNWLDNGRSGKLSLTRPNLIYHVTFTKDSVTYNADALTPMSLLNFLYMPATAMHKSTSVVKPLRSFLANYDYLNNNTGTLVELYNQIGNYTDYFPADCAFAYQRNWRDFYSNKNLLQNNKHWFPDNEDHFILSYSAENCVAVSYEDEDFASKGADKLSSQFENLTGVLYYQDSASDWRESFVDITPEPNNPASVSSNFNSVKHFPNLAGIKFRQFRGDRYTTSSPFPDLIRGDIPTLQLTEDNYVRWVRRDGSSSIPIDGKVDSATPFSISASVSSDNHASFSVNNTVPVPDNVRSALVVPYSSITMSDIYTLETLTSFKRRMGMTNGDYNEMIESQYGVSPRVRSREGTYIGGFYQDFAFSSVTQTSESSSSPLGTKAGQGVSSGSGSFGHFHSPDFGWIQVYMSVVPDVYYTQGKPRQYSKKSNLEMYFPLFNNLPAQGIRNDELFITDNSVTNAQPFGYEDRYAEFKSIPNRVTGFMALSHSQAEYDSSRIMARRFSSKASLNSLFVTMVPENVDMEVFAVQDEPPLDFSIGFNIRRVFPGPYTAIEGSLSSPLLNKA